MHQITILKNFTEVVQHLLLPEVVALIRGANYQKEILSIRQAINDQDKDLADKLKKRLLGFTVSGRFEGGRRMEYLKQYNPFVILDIDWLDIKDVASVVDKIKSVPYLSLIHI